MIPRGAHPAAVERAQGERGMTLSTWARVHGFECSDTAAVYLDLPRDAVATTFAPACSACSWPLTAHDPVWPGEGTDQ